MAANPFLPTDKKQPPATEKKVEKEAVEEKAHKAPPQQEKTEKASAVKEKAPTPNAEKSLKNLPEKKHKEKTVVKKEAIPAEKVKATLKTPPIKEAHEKKPLEKNVEKPLKPKQKKQPPKIARKEEPKANKETALISRTYRRKQTLKKTKPKRVQHKKTIQSRDSFPLKVLGINGQEALLKFGNDIFSPKHNTWFHIKSEPYLMRIRDGNIRLYNRHGIVVFEGAVGSGVVKEW